MGEAQQHSATAVMPQKAADANSRQGNRSSTLNIWGSWIGWRVTLMVFVIVLLIQTSVCFAMMNVYEIDQLSGLREIARTALAQSLHDRPDAPLEQADAKKMMAQTVIQGFAVYNLDYSLIARYGAPLALSPRADKKDPGFYRSQDGLSYEVSFTSNEIGHPYNIIANLDASDIVHRVAGHTIQTLKIFFALSIFVTGILVVAMNQLLLAPMLRRNDSLVKKMNSEVEDRIRKIAYYDTLTGLPNRTFFLENLEESIKNKTHGEDSTLAIMCVDIDHFKDINDAMGHDVGDKLLEVIAQRLVQSVPERAVVARASADEFVVMVPLPEGQSDSSMLAEKILSSMQEPMEIVHENILVRASIGVAHYPLDGNEALHILKNADIALNRAKAEGRATVRYYSKDFDQMVRQRAMILRDLRKALEQKELQVFYHPQFDLRTGAMIGCEALIRWFKPDGSKEGGKFISPAEFIPVAEQSGLIVPIGEYVIRVACATAKSWQDRGMPPIRMAVNISGVQFHRSDIVSMVADVLHETRLEAKYLELELTESIFIEDAQGAINILDQFHELGVELSVDDFGTGYSSLSYLRQFPIDRLKIDQSFIRTSLLNINDRMITRAIINIGHSLGLRVIAEGVETKDHEELLKEENCDEVQGFKYSKPIPADKFWDFTISYNDSLAKNNKMWIVE